MTYQQTLDYLFEKLPMYHRIGDAAYKADLDNTLALLKVLKEPHKGMKFVHVAGTNGKGSVSNFLAAILQSAGYKTGLYTSPHLKDFRERIRINGKMIPEKYVVEFVQKHKTHFEKIEPSFFEWSVALAFDYFRTEKPDVAIIETGLGGRLDSTNVINPLFSIITNIGLDHTALLGDTLEKIATEKAGIIKPGTPVVIGESQQIKNVFVKKAKTENSRIVFADKEYKAALKTNNQLKLVVDIFERRSVVQKNMEVGIAGMYQVKNVQTVFSAINVLHQKGFLIKSDAVLKGFKNVMALTGFAGRWHILSQEPLTIADTGHNAEGLRHVVEQIERIPFKNLHFVLGIASDKSIEDMLSLLPKKGTYYFCKANVPRALDENELRQRAHAYGMQGESYNTVKEAFEKAKATALKDDLIFVGGSTYVVAEVL
ncbi:MAG: bifunctional folylpolyglutamate synthase/dihydrofolate synthase [Bacteroidetes bacterium]|nr:bifunctional folylpolyglutamate synthase/dihydrofolate synthase [Bacteroidota bacterium]HNR18364.1 folylpolyglutamate synthase/dihydrofolate synthase family protein [Bacteroidia bacterium]HNU32316.1 folylpolyglutamate synthase/dihydrofolate synthase family protein [Bacteroidia bacterium]